jgi:FlaA1/EpsC-like NDP-sugar epimerase
MARHLFPAIETWLDALARWLIEKASYVLLWPRASKRIFVMLGDAVICVLAIWLAFSLRLGEWRLLDWPVIRFTLSTMAVWFPVALYQGVYSAIFRFAGRGTIVGLSMAMVITSIPLIVVYAIYTYPGVPRTVALLGPMMFLAAMSVARIIGRYVLIDLLHSRPEIGATEKRMLVYGAGSLGQRLAASLVAEKGLRLVGYIDDDPGKHRQRLDGRKVWHSSELEAVIKKTGATDVILAMSDIGRSRKREIVEAVKRYPVEVQALPPMRELIIGNVTINDLRPIDVEDLLGRAPVQPDVVLLARSVMGKRVMVTGAGGSIGSEICRQAIHLAPAQLVLVEANEFALFAIEQELQTLCDALPVAERPRIVSRLVNVANEEAVQRLFATCAPNTVYHAAAYKHVPLIEDNVLAGVENNLFGTLNCAVAARAAGVERFILISTDKAVRPPNVMGASKRVCEMVLQALDADQRDKGGAVPIFAMVRFGNVLGSSGSVVPLFRRQIAEGGPVTVTHRDVTRFFMTIPEASQLVIQAAGMAKGGEVFVLDMGEPVRIWDLARTMIKLAGLTVREPGTGEGDIEIVENGLRSGEKLYEELLIDNDPLPTSHPRIMCARESLISLSSLLLRLEAIRDSIMAGNIEECRSILHQLVPTLPPTPPGAAPRSLAEMTIP